MMPEWLAQRARLTPDRAALVYGEEHLTFAELDARVAGAAAELAASGVARGDRVALLAENSGRAVEAIFAIARLGAVLVPLNTRLSASELSWQIGHIGTTTLVADEPSAPSVAQLPDGQPELRILALDALTAAGVATDGVPAPAAADLSSVHSILFTSGTSGRPKGAMLTFGNHYWSAVSSALNLGLHEDDRWLACMPFYHVGGLAILLRATIYGIPVVVQRGFDAERVNQAIDTQDVTIVSVVSTMLRRMLDARGGQPYPPTLRCVLLGGGAASPELLERCEALSVPVVPTYGLTEAASQVATMSPHDAARGKGATGKPLFGTEVRIVGDGGASVEAGVPGEIAVRGPTVMAGYFRRDKETTDVMRDGWLHTGDTGYLDGDGYLFVLDRRGDLIVSGGENVYPAEVEAALESHPLVLEAAVTGVPDEEWGERVVASVVLRPDASVSEEELRAFCRERLAGYKAPKQIRFETELPRSGTGKLLREAVKRAWRSSAPQGEGGSKGQATPIRTPHPPV